ncbi:MAG: hypothetical protein EBS72_12795 [Rhizobiales bacterium]|nr:hypothetical protein [Hyphomicrobiales bacterium]
MSAIITYTANPAIDVWAQCDTVVATEKTRVTDVRYDAGGGGINVARVLVALGAQALPVYLAGGATGPLFETLLKRTINQSEPISIAGDTRLSEVIYERSTGRELRFVAEGPMITAQEATRIGDHIRLTARPPLSRSGRIGPCQRPVVRTRLFGRGPAHLLPGGAD